MDGEDLNSKIIEIDDPGSFLEQVRPSGKKIVLCHGVFDLLHIGHLRHLSAAKKYGDLLVVSITADLFVNKGPGRPVFNQFLRAEALAALEVVDFVVIAPSDTALRAISYVKPDFYIKGSDYEDEKSDATGNIKREREATESFGGVLRFTNEIVFSSSQLINEHISTHSLEVKQWLRNLDEKHSLEEILSWLDRITSLRVLIVGEVIIDQYTECDALGKSSKDPVLCFSLGSTVSHAGGALAVASHCAGLGLKTTVVSGMSRTNLTDPEVKNVQELGVDLQIVDTFPRPTIRKNRLIDSRTGAKVLEIYEMDDSVLSDSLELDFINLIEENAKNADIVIVTDYGHGLVSDAVISKLTAMPVFLAINVQSNAGNRGFNSVSRYPRADFVTLNGAEANLEARRRHADLLKFIPKLQLDLGSKSILVTLGAGGLDLYMGQDEPVHAPALANYVRDRVGAGDAVLSVTALLSKVQAPPEVIGLIGNMVGAWAISFIGNEKSLERGTLIKQIVSTLK